MFICPHQSASQQSNPNQNLDYNFGFKSPNTFDDDRGQYFCMNGNKRYFHGAIIRCPSPKILNPLIPKNTQCFYGTWKTEDRNGNMKPVKMPSDACIRRKCKVPTNLQIGKREVPAGTLITIPCRNGKLKKDIAENGGKVRCQTNGQWSINLRNACQRKCGKLPKIPNSKMELMDENFVLFMCVDEFGHPADSEDYIEVECKRGRWTYNKEKKCPKKQENGKNKNPTALITQLLSTTTATTDFNGNLMDGSIGNSRVNRTLCKFVKGQKICPESRRQNHTAIDSEYPTKSNRGNPTEPHKENITKPNTGNPTKPNTGNPNTPITGKPTIATTKGRTKPRLTKQRKTDNPTISNDTKPLQNPNKKVLQPIKQNPMQNQTSTPSNTSCANQPKIANANRILTKMETLSKKFSTDNERNFTVKYRCKLGYGLANTGKTEMYAFCREKRGIWTMAYNSCVPVRLPMRMYYNDNDSGVEKATPWSFFGQLMFIVVSIFSFV